MDRICPDTTDDHEDTELYPTAHLPSRLYMVVITHYPEWPIHTEGFTWDQWWHEVLGHETPAPDFFWPTHRNAYRSRSAAVDRLRMFTMWGAEGHLVECTPTWETIPEANARRAHERTRP